MSKEKGVTAKWPSVHFYSEDPVTGVKIRTSPKMEKGSDGIYRPSKEFMRGLAKTGQQAGLPLKHGQKEEDSD
jgi:hypothetical protein